MTTYGATSDDNIVKLTIFLFSVCAYFLGVYARFTDYVMFSTDCQTFKKTLWFKINVIQYINITHISRYE